MGVSAHSDENTKQPISMMEDGKLNLETFKLLQV